MVWLICVLVALVAMAVWLTVVPRIRITADDSGDPPPDFRSLLTTPRTIVLALAALAASQILHLLPHEQWWLWAGYIAVGAPLVLVDAVTTWLPRRLHLLLVAAMLPGLAWLAMSHWPSGVGALFGGAAGFLVLFLAWRIGSGLGFGDVRLAAPMGAVAGASGAGSWFYSLLAATVIGAVWAAIHVLRRRANPQLPAYFPYGPALWLGPLVGVALSAV